MRQDSRRKTAYSSRAGTRAHFFASVGASGSSGKGKPSVPRSNVELEFPSSLLRTPRRARTGEFEGEWEEGEKRDEDDQRRTLMRRRTLKMKRAGALEEEPIRGGMQLGGRAGRGENEDLEGVDFFYRSQCRKF